MTSFQKFWVIDNQWIGFSFFDYCKEPMFHGRCEYGEPEGLEGFRTDLWNAMSFCPFGDKISVVNDHNIGN